jgi:DNA-binding response OmpR family regulator
MPKVLIVEDEDAISAPLAEALSEGGFDTILVSRGDDVLNCVLGQSPDIVLLDVVLPGMDGFEACRQLRQRGIRTPIILLTARKTDELHKVVGLEIGADDYIIKPFGIRELEARIRVQLRHSERRCEPPLQRYRFDDVEIDFENRRVTRRRARVELTAKEFDVLRFLIQHRGELTTRESIMQQLWGYSEGANSRTLDTHILNLRKKLERNPAEPRRIVSIYGAGYLFKD